MRRCELSVPGSSEKMMVKAAGLEVDCVFLDLEDAVAENMKVAARGMVVNALNTLDWTPKTRAVRINDLESRYAYRDVIEVVTGARENLDVIIIPKVKRASDVLWVDTLLNQIELDIGLSKKIGLEAIIEEAEAMMHIDEIAASSPRLEAMVFGMGDYSASQGMAVNSAFQAPDYPGDVWHYARNRLIIACRVNGLAPLDGPHVNFRDADACRQEAVWAKTLGCVGKWAIHPSQAEIVQEVFSPDPAEVEKARRQCAAFAEAEKEGLASVNVDGVMVDVASIRILRGLVERAERMGL